MLFVVIGAIAAALGSQLPASSSSRAPSTGHRGLRAEHLALPPIEHGGALGEADGAVPGGTTVFDGHVPGVANLAPALLGALRRAATAAADDGVEFRLDSGWRSVGYQEELLRQAIAKYGSEAEATRWVATPSTSAHVKGDAVDMASAAAAWLSAHGSAYGLCQIYGNEPWHYEVRPDAVDHGCPALYVDPTHDPRMRQ